MSKPTISRIPPPACLALAAALLFGAATPAAKLLIEHVQPQLLAGLLYLGSGMGLLLVSLATKALQRPEQNTKLRRKDIPWLAGAVAFGGIAGPLLMMIGLSTTAAGSASLLLNMEAVFTALIAWFVFKENFDRRIFFGMVAIVFGGILLSWPPGGGLALSVGSLAIVGCCFCWALDNNVTRNISDADPVQIASIKGLVAGLVNCTIALFYGASLPGITTLANAAIVGFLGYGISLVLYIKALRHLGTARTGAYFATAPFVGAILSLLFLHETLTASLLIASVFMALGVWLHLTETHEHKHSHTEVEHEHLHYHDAEHQHQHEPGTESGEPHSHTHKHPAVTHSHPHYPDMDHRHEH